MWFPISQPLDLALTLQSGQVFRWKFCQGWWSGFIAGQLFCLRERDGGLDVQTSFVSEKVAQSYIEWFLRMDDDLGLVYQQLSWDSNIVEACRLYRGMRLLRQDPWECLVAFISSTASNIPRIASIQEKLAEIFGNPVSVSGVIRNTFPNAITLCAAGESMLRNVGLGYRAHFVDVAAKKVASGELVLEELSELSYHLSRERLMSLPGVGIKVADCVELFAFGHLDSFPIDRWVRRALEHWYLDGKALSDRELGDWGRQTFGPWAGYAQQYLFFKSKKEGLSDRKI